METLASTINQRPIVPTGSYGSKPIDPIATTVAHKTIKLTKQEVQGCDIALSQYADVMHPDFYAWYCKAFYKIGRDRFHILASQARSDGKVPAKLFSSLIKKELAS